MHSQRDTRHAGSALIKFWNSKKATYKRLHSPKKPLTKDDLAVIQEKVLAEWGVMPEEERQDWVTANAAAARLRAAVRKNGSDGDSSVPGGQFKGLWGASSDSRYMIDPSLLLKGDDEPTKEES